MQKNREKRVASSKGSPILPGLLTAPMSSLQTWSGFRDFWDPILALRDQSDPATFGFRVCGVCDNPVFTVSFNLNFKKKISDFSTRNFLNFNYFYN